MVLVVGMVVYGVCVQWRYLLGDCGACGQSGRYPYGGRPHLDMVLTLATLAHRMTLYPLSSLEPCHVRSRSCECSAWEGSHPP
jgi:hypothetical protein